MSATPLKSRSEDAITLIEREIARAEFERTPISRQMLADLVHEGTSMPLSDALPLVEEYCEERAAWVPGYLQEEFAIPYLKVLAIINVIIGVVVFWIGVNAYRSGKPVWPYLVAGTLVCGLGAWFWVVSLERYMERRKKRA
ncbi:MAG TPA: hypothetical protein VK934_10585 [Fimbriimonas sp.]|nr:hypothetical protein [Fimbriimonas sp.]